MLKNLNLELEIKRHKEGIDYTLTVSKADNCNYYVILSERLKEKIWPEDYFYYNESVLAIYKGGNFTSWRIAKDPAEPYKKFREDGLKEIMNGNEPSDNFGRDKKKRLLEQKPFQEEKNLKEGVGKESVGKEVKNTPPKKISTNLEVSELAPRDICSYDDWTKNQLISEINKLKTEIESLKTNPTLTNSEKQTKIQQNQQQLEKLNNYYSNSVSQLNNNSSSKSNLPTNLAIGGTVLAIVGLVALLVIRKTAKIKK